MNLKSTKADADKRWHKLSLLAASLLCTAIVGLMASREAKATPGSGVTAQPMAVGGLPESIREKLKADSGFESGVTVSDIAVVKFTIAPGGYFGWHRHGGPVWVVVEEGTLTLYDPDVPGCARTYGPGSAFLDIGDHVHNARNEGAVSVVVYGTFMLPEGGALRVDAPDPGLCVLPPL
jgi:quercetin dioxygenase-like cupin family protein